MRTTIRFDASQLNAAFTRLTALYDGRALGRVMELVAERIELLFELDYPPQSRATLEKRYRWPDGRLSKFKSIRHQRAFFAMVMGGEISIPYRRTFRLRKAVRADTRQTSRTRGEVTLRLDEQIAPHARYVVGSPQASYFANRTRWKEFKQMIEDQKVDVRAAYDYAVETVMEDLL